MYICIYIFATHTVLPSRKARGSRASKKHPMDVGELREGVLNEHQCAIQIEGMNWGTTTGRILEEYGPARELLLVRG